ncbi:MAG: hypothetical protein A3K66_06225 [Euryarchaeota archaeon RBG_16_67_27]|nr:MAG: hypothetical protein A3K66_06225 [Euryarchaeota archaeon RBG_16_67_27]
MALLPDLAAAAVYAAVVFFVAFGFLVVFVETIRPSRVLVSFIVSVVLAVGLGWAGEPGLGFLPLAGGCAVLASRVFESLTMR